MADTQTKTFERPVELAKTIGVKPQLVFAWIRGNKLVTKQCECGHTLVNVDSWNEFMTERETKAAEKAAKVEAELVAEPANA